MKKFLKQSAGLVTRLRDRLFTDIFASAHFRITLLFLIMGGVILAVAGILAYQNIINLIQALIESIRIDLASNGSINQETGAAITIAIEENIRRMISGIGLWMFLTMLISAYVLAEITLRPIKRVLETQKRFVANVSHELRTPLSIMKTGSEATLLNKSDITKEELVATLKSNMEEIDRMSKILQFLLNFSSFENRMKTLAMTHVNFSELVRKTVAFIETTAAKKNISIEVRVEQNAVVRGNAVALEEMVLNLLKNAIRYTSPGGQVRITLVRKHYTTVLLAVNDTGIGIPPKDLPYIFEPFYKGKNVTAERKDNAGLGLAIVKEIATFHRGAVAIQSAVNVGTTVFVRLPSAQYFHR